jgi:anti-sigma factor ChrR (cupin superfamily)
MQNTAPDILALRPETVVALEIGPGCRRRDLPAVGPCRTWIVEMDPGSVWPVLDQHDRHGEIVLVLSGEMIDGDRRFAAGTYLVYSPHSAHQPHTEVGARLFGINGVDDVRPSLGHVTA